MIRKIFYISSIIIFLFACSTKTTEVVVDKTPTVEKPIEVVDNPCITFSKLSPAERDETETAYVLYRDLVKLKKYNEALDLWKQAFYAAPAGNGKITYQFDDGVAIYKALFSQSKEATEKQAIVDTIMNIYAKRIECYGEADYIKARMAFDYYYTFYEYKSQSEIYNMFREVAVSKQEKADYFIINPFTKMVFDRFLNEEISLEEAQENATILLNAIEYGNANCKGKECGAWEIINSYAPARLESLEGVDGFYGCEYYTNKYYPQFIAAPTDCEVINLVYRRMLRGACDQNDPKLVEVAKAKETNCYVAPPPPGNLTKAFDAYNSGKYKEAIGFFQQYIDNSADNDKRAKYQLVIAKIYYGDIKNFPQARKFAKEAAKNRPSWGEPYILIGKLYASSGPLCGPGTGFDSQRVVWPAIDMFEKAKKIDADPDITKEANKWIAEYYKYMPKKEDIFFRSMKKGDSYKVDCWINENTIVRTAD